MSSERPLESKTGGRAATTGVIPGDFAISVGNPGTPLTDGWTWTLLTEVARLETGHTPSRKHPEYWGGDVPWIGIRDATGNHGQKIFETAQYTNELGIRNSSARILPPNTVCLSRTASVGYVVVMGVPMATSQDFVNWVCGSKLDYRFLKYILLGERNSFLRFASGTTHQTIYFPEVKAFHAALPDIGIQRRVADVLSALDERITLLRETNATLEAIAQAMFNSWFVDFDPVRAKMEGRAPEGMDEATAALFPDRFEVSNAIPFGWRRTSVGESFILTMGQSPPGDTYNEIGNGLPFYQGRTDFGFRFPTKRIYCAAPTRIAEIGDTLVSVRAPVGDVNMAIERCCVGRGVAAVRHPDGYRGFVFHAMRGLHQRFETFDSEGTVFGSISKKDFAALPVIAPPQSLMAAFDDVSAPIDARIVENEEQVRTLTVLRDTLLPRLISGQLRLPTTSEEATP